MINKNREKLIRRYLSNEASEQELMAFFEEMKDETFVALLRTIEEEQQQDSETKHRSHTRTLFMRWAAAACLAIGLGLSMYTYHYKGSNPPASSAVQASLSGIENPKRDRASLTLSNGDIIALDTISLGTFTQDDHFRISKNATGEIIYESLASPTTVPGPVANHTIHTANGAQFKVHLSDGTTVWLNASSSLTFPSHFDGQERRVTLSGEGYFEVAKQQGKPFIVASRGQEVEVLGTHFNIQAYDDDEAVKTALLEGSVNVVNKQTQKKIKLTPGEQSILQEGTFRSSAVNVEQAIAWKNGSFVFQNEDLKSIMRKIARWYDVEISYEDPQAIAGKRFSGSISRFSNAEEVLEMLVLTEAFQFKVAGRRVIIMK